MKKVLILCAVITYIYADFNVTHSEEVYDTSKECVEVNNVSAAGTAVGGVVGGTVGSVGGEIVGRSLGLKGWGGLLGGLVGTGVGAEVGGNNKTEQCTTRNTLVGYYNYYLKDGKQQVIFSKQKLKVIFDEK